MTLGFMQTFPWKVNGEREPTNFREKILAGAIADQPFPERWFPGAGKIAEIKLSVPKIHTIRLDPHNRWKAGRKIEMVYRGAGYKIIDHFNKGIPELEKCVSVQRIKLKWIETKIDNDRTINTLLISIDFEGNLIHWTNLTFTKQLTI